MPAPRLTARPEARRSAPSRDLGFVVLKPDAVRQSLQGSILRFLEELGLVPVWTRVTLLSADHRAWLYRNNPPGRLDWELGGRLYTLGPAMAVGLRARGDAAAPAAVLCSRAKGHFVPSLAAPETIRGRFPAHNPVFNLIHASDHPEEAAEDQERFAGQAPVTVDELRRGRPAVFRPMRLLAALKQRWAAAVPGLPAKTRELLAVAHGELAATGGLRSRADALRRARAALDAEHEILASCLQRPDDGDALAALEVLADRRGFSRLDLLGSVLDRSPEGRPAPDPWTHYLLLTTLHYLDFE